MSPDTIADRIRKARLEAGLTQAQVAETLGVTYQAVSNYERGKSRVDTATLIKLCALYNTPLSKIISVPSLFGEREGEWDDASGGMSGGGSTYPAPALPAGVAQILAELNDEGTSAWVDYGHYLKSQPKYRAQPGEKKVFLPAEPKQPRMIRHYLHPAAAGYVNPVLSEDYEMIDASSAPPDADYALTVSGDSMEPYIKDGSIVYVARDTDMRNGDVGIWFVDGETLVKQFCVDHVGNLYLFSLNRKRADADRTIWHNSGSNVICQGKVLMKKRVSLP